ncbi:hypothetical protein BDW59DRAFT_149612 [Aspergillus cavernicola]|uniref:Uncharacterized protein n=1 Tax=Aspergillus cavernicola TaxID=176166 RepID=A0ABR4I3S2_9EURO
MFVWKASTIPVNVALGLIRSVSVALNVSKAYFLLVPRGYSDAVNMASGLQSTVELLNPLPLNWLLKVKGTSTLDSCMVSNVNRPVEKMMRSFSSREPISEHKTGK